MKLEQQVTSLELSKRLKELGVKQDGHFFWISTPLIERQLMTAESAHIHKRKEPERFTLFAAFTVAELGEMLPTMEENWQSARYEDGKWFITNYVNTIPAAEADTEADARAKMLVYLLENKLITLQ